jgi:hypothetical protein
MGASASLELADGDVGDEAQAALVDAHQRQVPARQFTRDAQHGAVAAHHHGQVARWPILGAQGFEVGDAGGLGGVALEARLPGPLDQEVGDLLQHRADAPRLILANDRCMTEAQGHANDYTIGPATGPAWGAAPYNRTPMLDDRARTLLKTLVERYIADGTPVGSRTLSRTSGLDLSPATIRNVMADLEELGLIASPHTSAGRVPTARGYRLFVDTMLTARHLRWTDLAPCGRHGRGGCARAAAPRPAAARDRAGRIAAVQPEQLRGRGDRAAQGQRVPPHRVPAPG